MTARRAWLSSSRAHARRRRSRILNCPNLLLVGATSHAAGAVELSCEIIRRHAAAHPVVAVEVTLTTARRLSSPTGPGHDACDSVAGSYRVAEAAPGDPRGDASEMLRAGARRVLRLCAVREHLEAGLSALLGRVHRGELLVCASDSVHQVVEPGAFLLVRDAGTVEPWAHAMLARAGHVVERSGVGWDAQQDCVAVVDRRWVLRPDATAVVLAGGGSQRMGLDKSLLSAGRRPLIAHIADQLAYFPEVLIGANDPAKYAFLNLPVIPDREPGRGPLMGLVSCVERASFDLCFVTGCDIPALDTDFVLGLLARATDHDIVIPQAADGRVEPLLAVYRKTVVPVARAVLSRGGGPIVELLEHVRVRLVPVDALPWYRNLNTMEEYSQWLTHETLVADPD